MPDDGAGPRAAPHPHMLPRPGTGTVTIPATAARARLSVPAEDHATDPEDDEAAEHPQRQQRALDRKSTRLNSSHVATSYAVCCLKKKRPPGPATTARRRDPP